MGSIVSYATETKINVLGVSPETIQKFSVVSAEVAQEMAVCVQRLMKTDYAIATTGNAGPTKGDAEAEVGTVFIALATPKGTIVEEFNFGQQLGRFRDSLHHHLLRKNLRPYRLQLSD